MKKESLGALIFLPECNGDIFNFSIITYGKTTIVCNDIDIIHFGDYKTKKIIGLKRNQQIRLLYSFKSKIWQIFDCIGHWQVE